MKMPSKRRDPASYQKAWENRWLIYNVLRTFGAHSCDRDELVSMGLDALAGAFENYDPAKAKGSGFAAYASQSVKLAMRKVKDRDSMIHVPEWARTLAMDCIRGHRRLEDIPERMHESRQARECVAAAIVVLRGGWCRPDDVDAEGMLSVTTESGEWDDCEDLPPPLSERTRAALDRLPKVQRTAVEKRYGLGPDGADRDEATIAVELGYRYPSDARRIIRHALNNLRKHLESVPPTRHRTEAASHAPARTV